MVSGGPDSGPLPPVGAYRYLGVPWVSRGFGGAGLVRALVERGDAKSGALAGWRRLSGLSLDLVAGVWHVAVLPALFGLAFVAPAACPGPACDWLGQQGALRARAGLFLPLLSRRQEKGG